MIAEIRTRRISRCRKPTRSTSHPPLARSDSTCSRAGSRRRSAPSRDGVYARQPAHRHPARLPVPDVHRGRRGARDGRRARCACEGGLAHRTTRSGTPSRTRPACRSQPSAGTRACRCAGSTIPDDSRGRDAGHARRPAASDDNGGKQVAARVVVHAVTPSSRSACRSRAGLTSRARHADAARARRTAQPRQQAIRRRRRVPRATAGSCAARSCGTAWERPRLSRPISKRDLRRWAVEGRRPVQALARAVRRRPRRRLDFSAHQPAVGSLTWDANVTRLELGGGWLPCSATCS